MDIKEIIFELENKLQHPNVRKSPELLNDLISDDLIEFGSSGKIYTKRDVLINLPNYPEMKFIMTDFQIRIISPDIVQTLFKTEKTSIGEDNVTRSLRSSLWKKEGQKWKMLFHQGTLITN